MFNLRAKQKSYGLYNNHNKNLKRPKTGNKFIKINEDKKRNKSMDEKEKEKNGENENIINKFNNAEIKNKMISTNYYNEMKKRARNKWLLENVQMKEFKKIKESRNKDKILKIHNQQPLVKCLNEFNRLIKQTNKLFVYKYKISPKDTKTSSTKRFLGEKRMKKSKSMESFKSGNKTEVKIEKDDKDNELSLNIEHKIDELIKNLQGEKLKFSFPTKT